MIFLTSERTGGRMNPMVKLTPCKPLTLWKRHFGKG